MQMSWICCYKKNGNTTKTNANKIKKKQEYHTVGTIPKSNIKIVGRWKIDKPNTQIHDHTLSWLGKGTSIKT
jgi:hypothetical protein